MKPVRSVTVRMRSGCGSKNAQAAQLTFAKVSWAQFVSYATGR
ncbi:hypothetical protein [Streptomyces sporangiiformans]|nr:hypothetical protein [Streptomyces sporangiiformans]